MGCALLLLAFSTSACDTVTEIVGGLSVVKNVGQHLEQDLKSPLTEAKISKVVSVVPALSEFSKEAKVKWTPDPEATDVTKLATSLAGLSDYVSFFESHDTRLTEFYCDFVKINDAKARLEFEEGRAQAKQKLEDERKKLEGKLGEAKDDQTREAIRRKLKQNELTSKKLAETMGAAEQFRKDAKNAAYQLSPEEIALVQARLAEINSALEGAGFVKTKKKKP